VIIIAFHETKIAEADFLLSEIQNRELKIIVELNRSAKMVEFYLLRVVTKSCGCLEYREQNQLQIFSSLMISDTRRTGTIVL